MQEKNEIIKIEHLFLKAQTKNDIMIQNKCSLREYVTFWWEKQYGIFSDWRQQFIG